MKKQGQRKREKSVPVQEKDLAWVKGASGYNQTSGNEEDPDPNGGG